MWFLQNQHPSQLNEISVKKVPLPPCVPESSRIGRTNVRVSVTEQLVMDQSPTAELEFWRVTDKTNQSLFISDAVVGPIMCCQIQGVDKNPLGPDSWVFTCSPVSLRLGCRLLASLLPPQNQLLRQRRPRLRHVQVTRYLYSNMSRKRQGVKHTCFAVVAVGQISAENSWTASDAKSCQGQVPHCGCSPAKESVTLNQTIQSRHELQIKSSKTQRHPMNLQEDRGTPGCARASECNKRQSHHGA